MSASPGAGEPAVADAASPRLAFSRFCTDGLPAAEALAIWRESIAPMFDASPERPERFRGVVDACLFDGLVLAQSRASAQAFRRDRPKLRRDGIDHLLLQLYLAGGYAGEHRGRPIAVRTGDIGILDLAAETHTRDLDFHCLTLVLPRDQLRGILRSTGAGGVVIAGASPLGRILTSHIKATWRVLPDLTERDAPHAAAALLGVIAACVESQRRADQGDPPLPAATAVAMRDYIEQHLDRPDLGAEHLCRAFRCSRSYLYRLFADGGGVARYIQQRRLARCWRELTRATGGQARVLDIALNWGFVNPSHFSRVFRAAFGITPRDALGSAGPAGPRPCPREGLPDRDLPAYRDWLLWI